MFHQPEILDTRHHGELRYKPLARYDFAREQMLVPLVAAEVSRIAREMPVVFPGGDDGLPQALAGLAPGENLHIADTGKWLGRYVPAVVRSYPFRLTAVDGEDRERLLIQIDRAAPHFDSSDGERLMDGNGVASAVLRRARDVLMALHRDEQRTRAQVAELAEARLLVEKEIAVSGGGDDARGLSGMRVIDRSALRACSGDTLQRLHSSGALALAYEALLSLTNLDDGLLAERARVNRADIGDLLGDGDDAISFDFDNL
ncbi:SapC family protein [Arhodomonas sp. SL1]|uniref:SapC family protein n=1 Tax=Arhodomonas sp. SL1 TaxID=3425691 RepID=UPI003F881321